jgi:hypothetical protein
MLKDNIERDIEEIELMIYGLKEIDKNTILAHFYYPRILVESMNSLPS